MKPLIESLRITGYRGFREARVDRLGQVNLITGRNGSGKSTLLEAIQLLVSGGAASAFLGVMNGRDEIQDLPLDETGQYRSLFHGFPPSDQGGQEFSIAATGSISEGVSDIKVRLDKYPVQPELFAPPDALQREPVFQVIHGEQLRYLPLSRLSKKHLKARMDDGNPLLPCVHLDPCSSRTSRTLGPLWDAIALTEMEAEVVRALRLLVSDVQAVSMVGSLDLRGAERQVIVKCARFPRPVLLKSFGDGVGRIFGIVLALCNVRNGVLLVDEVENGLHYSVQAELWSVIFRLAQSINVQVFATTHSWDCVRAFQQAASASPMQGVLTRLTRKEDTLHVTTFSERELEIVTQDRVEVR